MSSLDHLARVAARRPPQARGAHCPEPCVDITVRAPWPRWGARGARVSADDGGQSGSLHLPSPHLAVESGLGVVVLLLGHARGEMDARRLAGRREAGAGPGTRHARRRPASATNRNRTPMQAMKGEAGDGRRGGGPASHVGNKYTKLFMSIRGYYAPTTLDRTVETRGRGSRVSTLVPLAHTMVSWVTR